MNDNFIFADSDLSKDIINFFMNIPVFSGMNAEELKIVAGHMSPLQLSAGETLFHESDKGNYVCFIAKGRLDVIKKKEDEDNKEVIIASLEKGRSIGEMAIIDDMPRSATVRAGEDALLYLLSQSAFYLILEKNPHVGIKLLKGIAKVLTSNLRITSSRLADYIPPIG